LSGKVATLEMALNKSEKALSLLQADNKEHDRQHANDIQDAIREGHEKMQGFIEQHTCDLQNRLTTEQELQTRLTMVEMRSQSLTVCIKEMEGDIRAKAEKIKSLEEILDEAHSKSSGILLRYERGELDHLERTLVSKVHEVAQSSQQRELIEKNNEIARVSSHYACSTYLKLSRFTSEIVGYKT
jgi:DNA-directed RNA polymerase beta' subunit